MPCRSSAGQSIAKRRAMKTNKQRTSTHIKILAIASLIFILALSLTSCATTSSEFVTGYLDDYGVPRFVESKMRGVELVYRDYYVEDLPEATELAKETAALYFEHFHEKIDTADKVAVTDALIYCYIEAVGDKYSAYRNAKEHEEYDTDMSGSFYGIGVVVTYSYVDLTITVNEVYSGGGAEEAGIKPGDVIKKVNGISVDEIGYDKAVNEIRGEPNTRVIITVDRDGSELSFDVTRKKVVEHSVSYSIDENKIGYIKITSFKSNTPGQFKEAINYMEDMGAVGIIYDLRSNPGGYLSSVVDVLSYIAPKNTTIVSFSNNYKKTQKDNNSHSLALPSVVICNEATASAGELFTAAMRDFDDSLDIFKVTTVGQKTYGKGVLQNTYAFTDDSTITLTVAYYNPPCGINYDGVGILPDVQVAESDEGDAQLDAAYTEIFKLIK